ncbi:MAG: ImmA/IrrE family metallo-endopeptidase [Gemmataceae bacterium]|nr:ImmA/IrrE family metallo-endopeptidase [Gemmataceae bacterium]
MRRYRDRTGDERLWFDDDEIETLVETELAKAGLLPSLDSPVVDVERFVESHLDVQFDPYAALPADTLGQTDFRVGERPLVMINADLSGAALDDDHSPLGLRGRWRATVAHEGCHVMLHRCLFNLNPAQTDLFDSVEGAAEPVVRLQRCLKRDVAYNRRASDWREVQANQGMAALLMPRPVFAAACRAQFDRLGAGRIDQGTRAADDLARRMAELFQVSRQAAAIRLGTLKLLSIPGQQELL